MTLSHPTREQVSFDAAPPRAYLSKRIQQCREAAMAEALRRSLTICQATGVLEHVVRSVAQWRRRQRELRELAGLGQRELRDIGVTPGEVAAELDKPFWRG
jgi:uncharacterized protein YjiS (DUF1127 family)